MAVCSLALGDTTSFSTQVRPGSISITDTIEVRDFRILPSGDTTRFLVELHNNSEHVIDTPSLGVTLPHLDPKGNFGWATPFQEVLHPKASAGLVGTAPASLNSDEDWDNPEWTLCETLTSQKSEFLSGWDISFVHTLEVLGVNDVLANIEVTNLGPALPTTVSILGLVRDHTGRIAGGTVPLYINSVKTGETGLVKVRVGPTLSYAANPYELIDTENGVTIDFSFQPWPSPTSPGCLPVMPWNRQDSGKHGNSS